MNNALDGDGPFAPERAGTLPAGELVDLCFSGRYTRHDIQQMLAGKGGLVAHLGTNSMIQVMERIGEGDEKARVVKDAMCYGIVKQIGAMAAALGGRVDAVILTGGIDLSVGSLLALSSALMGSLIVSGMNPMLAILAACFIGMGLGAVNGLVIAYGKVAPFIATLATMTIYRGLTLVYTNGNPISCLLYTSPSPRD